MKTVADVLPRFENVQPCGDGYTARCPAHDDQANSLSIAEGENGRIVLNCHAGCDFKTVLAKSGLKPADVRGHRPTRSMGKQPGDGDEPDEGLSLARYAEAKKLPEAYLRRFGITERCQSVAGVRVPYLLIPYHAADGSVAAKRIRYELDGPHKFSWPRGSKPLLYGLPYIERARELGYAILVEGESDVHTLTQHGFPALGLPGANSWNDERDAGHFEGIPAIFVVIEPDGGGRALLKRLSESSIADRVHVVRLGDHKDASALHIDDPDRFRERFTAALAAAVPLADMERANAEDRMREAWRLCGPLAQAPDILAVFIDDLRRHGLVGEVAAAKLVFLVITSRLLETPVSAVVKGPSSAGKSNLVQKVAEFFPAAASYALSAMSERALAYSEESLKYRTLILYEAAGMSGDIATYLMRSLLSEGRIRYETVEKTPAGLQSRLIEREGPTNLIVTTTAASLHPENETRMLSVLVSDDPAQTKAILYALADESEAEPVDLARWHALQEWLPGAEHRVTVPFASALADLVPPVAVRLRRDFRAVVSLIRTHALLHQATRERTDDGRIVATLADYGAVVDLVGDLVTDGAEVGVPVTLRETVTAVAELLEAPGKGSLMARVSVTELAHKLGLDKSSASRRAKVALERGYLRNEETRPGRAAEYTLGEQLPGEAVVFPSVEVLDAHLAHGGDGSQRAA